MSLPKLASRLNVSLLPDGYIRPSAIAAMSLVTLPIYDYHVAASAAIKESKLDLDYSTQTLYNWIKDLADNINVALGWINATGVKLNPHLAGTAYRHQLSDIDVSSSSTNYLKNKYSAIYPPLSEEQLLTKINKEMNIKNHL